LFLRRKFFRVKDCFALLGVPQRPLLDEKGLKSAYFRLAAECHPDAEGGDTDKFRELQEAYQTLKDPVFRLRHLAGVVFDSLGDSSRPSPQSDLFLQVGQVLQATKAFRLRREKSQSALARAVMISEGVKVREELGAVTEAVEQALREARVALGLLDKRWPRVAPEELLTLASGWRYLTRWQTELSGAEFGLMLEA
jgi:curved DNA-binding protein CbpA